MTRPFRPREIYAAQPAIARIHEELALIAEYEAGPEDGRPAYLTAMCRVDWEMELALMTRQKEAEMLYGNVVSGTINLDRPDVMVAHRIGPDHSPVRSR